MIEREVVEVAEINQHNKFGNAQQPFGDAASAICAQCEAMLADVIDGALSPDEQAVFDRHLIACADCSRMYIDARRGAEWLMRLKTPQPEPAAGLLERILASTGPAASAGTASASTQANPLFGQPMLAPAAASPAAYTKGNVLPFRRRVASAFRLQSIRQTFMQPRLAMTAAMAFFSIALTLNLTGVHVTQLRLSDLKPSSLKRSFYDTNARVMRSVDNLRVVYELESRVQDLRGDDSSNSSAPASSPGKAAPSGDQKQDDQNQNDQKSPAQQKQSAPRPRSGSSRSVLPQQKLQYTASASRNEQSGPSPQPARRLEQVSFVSTPNVFRHQQGGQA